ncbi:hypothetical protein M0804_001335 [Polistes exclamans]|nr:hypothetical protein M0804_001335 [Polistes exclamans]
MGREWGSLAGRSSGLRQKTYYRLPGLLLQPRAELTEMDTHAVGVFITNTLYNTTKKEEKEKEKEKERKKGRKKQAWVRLDGPIDGKYDGRENERERDREKEIKKERKEEERGPVRPSEIDEEDSRYLWEISVSIVDRA